MNDDIVSRRRLLAASLGAAAALPLVAACASPTRGSDNANSDDKFESPNVTDAPSARNVRDFGAAGDGAADDTAAIARACAGDGGPLVLYIPAGTYRVTEWPELADNATILGDGRDATTIEYAGDRPLITLRGVHRVSFARLGIYVTGTKGAAVSLSGCFGCSFDSVVLRGGHVSENYPEFAEQRGVILDENTGGTAFINCDISNFGFGLTTSCIQNYVTCSKFASNYIGVLGTGNDHNAGLSMVNVEFVSDTDPNTTDKHVFIDGAANDWWFTNVWFEGADVALSIGDLERGGPAQFGLVNCKIAASTVCVDLAYCRQPYLANIQFDSDTDSPAIELRIDSRGCPEGTAVNLLSSTSSDIDPATFPKGWNVTARGRISGATFIGTVATVAGSDNADLLQAQDSQGAVLSAVLASGAWLCERPDSGVILKDSANNYWRLSVSTDGSLETSPLGEQRPSG